MRFLLLWTAVLLMFAAVVWWRHPEGVVPDLGGFPDRGRGVGENLRGGKSIPPVVLISWGVLREMSGILLGGWLLGLIAGCHIRRLPRYASPTWAWLGKRLVGGGVGLLVLFVGAPVGWPMWIPYLSAGLSGSGSMLYIGNLPKKM